MTTNRQALEAATRVFPGGVNSPVRAFGAVGGDPLFMVRGAGARVTDLEGKTYLDYVGSWGPLILGHADPDVVKAVSAAAERGTTFGAPTLAETELAEEIREAFPAMEKMRLVSSGTEATMSAIRLARGVTGRPLIVKFDGCYHGHADSLLVAAGSGVATLGLPGCPGVPESIAANTLVVPFNDRKAVEKVFETHGTKIAAVIVEPVCGNMGVVTPLKGYLADLRKLTRDAGALLIFDEVMTGFRACFGGVSQLEGVTPDLTCLGKVVGGGLPLAVYGGKAKIMAHVAPEGKVYQAGTLSGNPVAVAAGLATLRKIRGNPAFYPTLLKTTEKLCAGLEEAARKYRIAIHLNRFGSMFTVFFAKETVIDFKTAKTADTRMFARFFRGMLEKGVYLPPSQFEAAFVSAAHTDEDVAYTIGAAQQVFETMR
ncbi:MAG: Glutamate-1-semialdehyde aminotransferase [Candidatus Ozemobacter sibiricus]|uniref:Glutamate-1-semialdehyde 2,1-aminomutase n=1 Tax=Candidatus Ozemobacter sibiricus TaxID=2268124 RepID=A0A367ZS46_9BACT|nr:MAG: Glutamate-1-semialdehyde aminotransferase [Candidatus Ozemobacter sibiricus]